MKSRKLLLTFLLVLCTTLLLGYDIVYSKEKVDFPFLIRVKADNLNLRTGPNINYRSLTQLMKKDVLNVVGKRYSWFKVHLPPRINCYVKKEYIEKRNGRAYSKVENLNVRSGPGLKFKVVGQLDKEEYLYIKSDDNGWLKTYPNKNCYGWIHKKYVKKIKATKQEKIALKKETYSKTENLKREKSTSFKPIPSESYQEKKTSQKKLSDKEKNKSKQKDVKEEKKYPSNYEVATGHIKDLGVLFYRPGTHKLVDSRGNILYYLKSDEYDLNEYIYGKVKIAGIEKVNTHYRKPTLKVKKIKYIEK